MSFSGRDSIGLVKVLISAGFYLSQYFYFPCFDYLLVSG